MRSPEVATATVFSPRSGAGAPALSARPESRAAALEPGSAGARGPSGGLATDQLPVPFPPRRAPTGAFSAIPREARRNAPAATVRSLPKGCEPSPTHAGNGVRRANRSSVSRSLGARFGPVQQGPDALPALTRDASRKSWPVRDFPIRGDRFAAAMAVSLARRRATSLPETAAGRARALQVVGLPLPPIPASGNTKVRRARADWRVPGA